MPGHTSAVSVIWLSHCCPVCSLKKHRVVPQVSLAWQVMASCKGWDTWSRLTVPAAVPCWNTTYSNKLHVNVQPHHNFASQVSLKHLCSRASQLKVQADEVQGASLWRRETKLSTQPSKKNCLVFCLLSFWAEDKGSAQVPSYTHEVLFLCRCPNPLGAWTP